MEAEQAVTLLCESALSVRFRDVPPDHAGVAEQADAPVSKTGPLRGVWVRVPPSVPYLLAW